MREILLNLYSQFQQLRGFQSFGKGSVIKFPYKCWSRNAISIGKNVFIAENSFFAVSTHHKGQQYLPKVTIGNNVCIGSNLMLASIDRVNIGDNVLISDRVFISDHIHGYEDISIPPIDQPLIKKGSVTIKEDSFIGINAVIMPGVTIGKHSVVGASSVVIHDVPEYTVVSGNPAKIIKKYNRNSKSWTSVKQK
jgi:acetyltransferase-like isoleucine patch superfamily enzyme